MCVIYYIIIIMCLIWEAYSVIYYNHFTRNYTYNTQLYNSCDQIYIFGYISRPHMGTFKLHISCTQAMCSLQYRPYVDHFEYT